MQSIWSTGRRFRRSCKKVIQRKVQLENLGEELRVLYVALTRAKEKLILIGSISNLEKKLKSFVSIQSREQTALPIWSSFEGYIVF